MEEYFICTRCGDEVEKRPDSLTVCYECENELALESEDNNTDEDL